MTSYVLKTKVVEVIDLTGTMNPTPTSVKTTVKPFNPVVGTQNYLDPRRAAIWNTRSYPNGVPIHPPVHNPAQTPSEYCSRPNSTDNKTFFNLLRNEKPHLVHEQVNYIPMCPHRTVRTGGTLIHACEDLYVYERFNPQIGDIERVILKKIG